MMMGMNSSKTLSFNARNDFHRKFSSEKRDLDDADEDGSTIYRGLAVPVDIRQVVEVKIIQFNVSLL